MRRLAALLAVVLLTTGSPLPVSGSSRAGQPSPASGTEPICLSTHAPIRRKRERASSAAERPIVREEGTIQTACAESAPVSPSLQFERYSTVALARLVCDRYGVTAEERDAAMAEIVSRGDAAARELTPMLEESDLAASTALARMGDVALPYLLAALRDEDDSVRLYALSTLEDMVDEETLSEGARARVAHVFMAALRDEDEDLRETAADGLGWMPEALPIIETRLRCGDERDRLGCLAALYAGYVELPDPAHTTLERTAHDQRQSRVVRLAAAFWLGADADAEEPLEALPTLARVPEVRLWALACAADDEDHGAAALAALRARAAEARALFLEAARTIDDPEVGRDAVWYLTFLEGEPLETWLVLARSARSSRARSLALDVLEERTEETGFGELAVAARAVFLDRLEDPDHGVRYNAAAGLFELHEAGHDAIEDLTTALRDRPRAADAAAWALGVIGPDDAVVSGLLANVARDRRRPPEVRAEALDSLLSTAPELAVGHAIGLLSGAPAAVRRAAVRVLIQSEEPLGRYAGLLRARLDDPYPLVRLELARIWNDDTFRIEDAVSALETLLADADDRVVDEAAKTLGAIGEAAHDAVPALEAALIDRYGCARPQVVKALGAMGEEARTAIPTLVEAFRRALRATISGQLMHLLNDLEWRPGPEDIPYLLATTERRHCRGPYDSYWCRAFLELLERSGTGASDTIPTLLATARTQDGTQLVRTIDALGHVSAGEPEVVRFLTTALRGKDLYYGCTSAWNVPAAAAEALGRIGTRSGGARAALEDAQRHECNVVREVATAALAAINGSEPDSRP